mmetsp:Transcript_1571/g.2381  ORF Transcript_1571/g.2381 Transcript_1571/m.2381 type:complete len:138 (+) Transcript_1571:153-566(+)
MGWDLSLIKTGGSHHTAGGEGLHDATRRGSAAEKRGEERRGNKRSSRRPKTKQGNKQTKKQSLAERKRSERATKGRGCTSDDTVCMSEDTRLHNIWSGEASSISLESISSPQRALFLCECFVNLNSREIRRPALGEQ